MELFPSNRPYKMPSESLKYYPVPGQVHSYYNLFKSSTFALYAFLLTLNMEIFGVGAFSTSHNSFNLQASPSQTTASRDLLLLSAAPSSSSRFKTAERSINKIFLMGRLGGDPEIRQFPSGDRLLTFNLATSDSWRDKASGDLRVRTEWHRVCVYDSNLVELMDKFARKGKRVYLEGSLQTRRWITPEGQERTITEVVIPRFRGEIILLEGNEDQPASNSASSSDHDTDSGLASSNGLYQRMSQGQ